jgi:hypothetical protein
MTKNDLELIAQILIMHQTNASNASMNSLIRQACTVLKGAMPSFNADKFTTYVLKHR